MDLDSLPVIPQTQDSLISSEAGGFYILSPDVEKALTAKRLKEAYKAEVREQDSMYLNIESVRFLYW